MKIRIVLTALAVAATGLFASAQPDASNPPAKKRAAARGRVSPHDTVSAMVGGNRVIIVYGRPYTRDVHFKGDPSQAPMRTVWGGQLVPLGDIWRAGADEATLLISAKPLTIGSGDGAVHVPAGVCSLYVYPTSLDDVKLVINSQYGQWGLEYHQDRDIGRVALEKKPLSEPVHQFTIAIVPTGGRNGLIALRWEDTEYTVPFTVDSSS